MTKITKKKSKEFVEKATAMLLELGVTESGRRHYLYDLETIAGNLKIQVDNDNTYLFSIYTKFDNPEIAKDKIAFVNKYSGKWNFNMTGIGIDDVDAVVNVIKGQMETILPDEN